MHPNEVNTTETYFKELGIDTSLTNFNYTPQSAKPISRNNNYLSYENNNNETKSMFNLHNNTTGDSEYRDEYMGKSSNKKYF